jgi:hypothetical protein
LAPRSGKWKDPAPNPLSIIHYPLSITPLNWLFYGLRTQTPDPVLTRYVQCLRFRCLPFQHR